MQINSAPITHDDLLATILDELNLSYDEVGTSIRDWSEEDERLRRVYIGGQNSDYELYNPQTWNVFYGYDYIGDRLDLMNGIVAGEDDIQSASSWLGAW